MKIKYMKNLILLFFLFCSLNLFAQQKIEVNEQDYQNQQVEMADAMRADGKIYVVVAVLVVIFAGFIGYAIRIDSKVSRLEKEMSSGKVNSKTAA